MIQQIAEQLTHPWVTIITSWLGSGLVGALVAGIYNLRAKQKEYVNDYYKMVIQKRIAAYEQLEQTTIIPLKCALADGTSDSAISFPVLIGGVGRLGSQRDLARRCNVTGPMVQRRIVEETSRTERLVVSL
jgi:hypothetical protein